MSVIHGAGGSLRDNNATIAGKSEARLVLAFALLQFGLHLWQCVKSGDPRLLAPHLVAYLHDLLVLGALLLVARGFYHIATGRFRRAVSVLSLASLLVAGMLLAIYPQTLREYLAFPVNIFAAGSGSTRVLLVDYLGLSRMWPAGLAVGIGVVALVAPVRLPDWRRTRFVLWGIVVVLGLLTAPRSPQPVLNSLKLEAGHLFARRQRVVTSLQRPPARSHTALATLPGGFLTNGTLTADHVFLIVLEGVKAGDFETELLDPQSKFIARVRGQFAYFRRYYATNLDSYTSLIAMLTAVQVPYRAYADTSLYEGVNRTSNLTRVFRERGFFTAFVSTCEYHPFVPTRNDWDRVLTRRDLPSLKGWVSLGSSRIETATEDRAALSTIVDFAVAHRQTFVMHEMIYGHTTEWRAKTGQTQLAYYDTYLGDLLDRLEGKGLGSRSLLIVVSDHGDRSKAAVAENYRVPLLVAGAMVAPGIDAGFRSHLDLPDIAAAYLTKTGLPPVRTETYAIGSTERWVYGTIKANGDHLFIDNETGSILSARGNLHAPKLRDTFQSSLNKFGVMFGR